ncbi:hypothetical protein, partial [Enterobacter cloacae complex sp. 2DZ2F20B]|uniref:hypothetical protein n=1 Tax=Enterobacter cloacae complex sp. 2DZ2F20B TaxID=2511993 RepID=UPI001CA59304
MLIEFMGLNYLQYLQSNSSFLQSPPENGQTPIFTHLSFPLSSPQHNPQISKTQKPVLHFLIKKNSDGSMSLIPATRWHLDIVSRDLLILHLEQLISEISLDPIGFQSRTTSTSWRSPGEMSNLQIFYLPRPIPQTNL